MTLLKDEVTVRLDDVSRAVDEAAALYDDLLAQIQPPSLREAVTDHARAQTALADKIALARRRAGELPQAGDPERAHLHAAGAVLRAAASPAEPQTPYLDALRHAAGSVAAAAAAALELELEAEVAAPLRELAASSGELRTLLAEHA